jgi:tetratricopeptide (TPR) repeat protein
MLALLLLLQGCVLAEGPARHAALPGFPVAAPGEAEGPRHRQVAVAFAGETVHLVETLESDGRASRAFLTQVDRHGEIVAREPATEDALETEPLAARPLPFLAGPFRVTARPVDGRIEIHLTEADPEGERSVRLAVLPRARATSVHGLVAPPAPDDDLPPLAAVSWESAEGGARVEGILVLDLRAGRARLHQKRGLAAHRAGAHPVAAAHFLAAWRLDPSDPLGAYNLACALTALGQHERALSYLDRAVALDPLRIRVFAAKDPDLDPLRDHPAFAAIVGPGYGHRGARRPADRGGDVSPGRVAPAAPL